MKEIDVPESWKGKRIFVKFEGAGSVANVQVNWVQVGEHKGAYNAFTFELTDYLTYGQKNCLLNTVSINQHVGKFDEDNKEYNNPRGKLHPEEKQTVSHMKHIKMITERDYIWGSYVWNMFDFASSMRTEGDTNNINDKGLVTHNRQTRKDAFYLYKANWNKAEQTVHLCSKRYVDRKEDVTDIIVFTTAPNVKLYINGKLIGTQKTDAYATVVWENVKLNKGLNQVEVRTAHGNDSAEWNVQ